MSRSAQKLLVPTGANTGTAGILKLAIMAVGGQGGGVLTGWIEALARSQGWAVQATSVAGVAQRTGSTIYYIEMVKAPHGLPVFSLAPAAGDLDILIAAEMMEVGRAIQRGFVTPDRTVLVGSTHRALAVSEKMAPGDGIARSENVQAAAEIAARQLILADFEQVAVGVGSVISASLFGALAGSGALPFARDAFEAAIRAGAKGIEPSLRAFSAGYDAAQNSARHPSRPLPQKQVQRHPQGPAHKVAAWHAVAKRVESFPLETQDIVYAGLRKVVSFQDIDYGSDYLDRVERVLDVDSVETGWQLGQQAAKYIANAMAYDDVIRVAHEKTHPARMARIQAEMGGAEVLQLTDYTHPRGEEIISLLPARLGRWIQSRPKLLAFIDRRVNKGRRLRTDRLWPFLQLWLIAGLKPFRRSNLRHETEMAHLETWLETSLHHARHNPLLGQELLKARRLIKGYSDTHGRGLSKFDRVMSAICLIANRPDAADWARRLILAALADEEGAALEGAIQTIESFSSGS